MWKQQNMARLLYVIYIRYGGKYHFGKKPTRKGLAVIYRQEILQDIALFTSTPKAQFYDKLFVNKWFCNIKTAIISNDKIIVKIIN